MAFFSLFLADLMLMGIGIAIIGLFGFGIMLIVAATIIKLLRRRKIKRGQTTYSKTNILSNIAIAVGIICIAPFIALLGKIL